MYWVLFNWKIGVQFQVLGEGTLVLKPSNTEDLQADYYPICLKFNVILMVSSAAEAQF